MIEWHARATRGPNYDTWFRGRFLEEWADPRAIDGLRNAFSRYDEQDIGRGLLATLNLFRLVARETGGKMGYPYPTGLHAYVTGWIKTCLS